MMRINSHQLPGGATFDVFAPGAVRAQHHAVLLRLLWAHREVSRAQLARLTGLSRSTVSTIVNDILATGLVRETRAGSSSGGRRPIMLGFDDDARVILGLDIGASHVGGVLTNLRGQILARREAPMDTRNVPEAALAKVTELALELLGDRQQMLLGTGVALPAPLRPCLRGASYVLSCLLWADGRYWQVELCAATRCLSSVSTTTPILVHLPNYGGVQVKTAET